MNYAPILITTLNRYDSFKRSIESLKKNSYAKYSDLIVAIDYPKNSNQVVGRQQIIKYLCGNFDEFKSLTIIKRKKNYGAIKNFEQLVKDSFERYDNVICVFDDLEFSPNFIEYMDRMLYKYKNVNSVVAVTGYSYPVSWQTSKDTNVVKENYVASIWGIGYWKNKYMNMHAFMKQGSLIKAFNKVYDNDFNNMTDWAIKDYITSICNGYSKKSFLTQVTDISMRIYLAIENKYIIMPKISKVRNHGFDGSGEFCERIDKANDSYISSNYYFSSQSIDNNETFNPIIDDMFDNELNRELMNKFDYISENDKKKLMLLAEKYRNSSFLSRKFLNIKHFFLRSLRYIERLI